MKKILLLLIISILCISFVYAVNFETGVSIIKDSIKTNESAQFLVTIKSNSTEQEEFRIYSPDVEWNVPTKTLVVQPKFEISEQIDITPTKHIEAGVYGVHLNIKQESTDELDEKLLFINVQDSGDEGYKPAVKMEVDMVRQINPREPFTIRINLENQNILNHTNLSMLIASDLTTLNKEEAVDLGPLEEKVVSFSYELDPLQQPKAYQVSFALMKGNETISSAESRTIEIISVTPEFKSSYETKKGFLKTATVYTYTNDGNVRNSQTIEIPISWFASIFTKTDGILTKGDGVLTADIELGPDESKSVSATTNYRIILYIIIIIIVALIAYFKFRRRLKVRKSVANISTEEGGISQLKIMLDIVNSSSKELKDVKIVDVVPTIADVKKEFAEGTLKPASILRHSSKGTILKWNIPELAPGEERLISYDIRSKLSIIGSFNLPKARVKFVKDGKEKTIYSNGVGVSP